MKRQELVASVGIRGEEGQAAVAFVLMLGLLLLAIVGFSVDLTNMWFHRQSAKAAADAACQAGAMDMLAKSAGMTLNGSSFIIGAADDCVGRPSATMCTYAAANGYSGAGLKAGSPSSSVSWSFPPPSSESGVTTSPSVAYPFLKVVVAENVPTYFMTLASAANYLTLNRSCTCGVVQVKGAAPMVVLHPSMPGSFIYNGAGTLNILGGPSRGLQVNSSSATAVRWGTSGMLNLSAGGPAETGSDVAIAGGPSSIPGSGTCNGNSGFCGGSTGSWKGHVLAIADPFGSVPGPAAPGDAPTPVWVDYGVDGCPDKSLVYQYYDRAAGKSVYKSCPEYYPGTYPSGITLGSSTTAIFRPGIYYMKGSLNAGASATVRMAKPSGYQRTDGVMFYFVAGSLNLSGCSGCSNSNVDNVVSTDLTCDGSSPAASVGMPSSIPGNVLWGQCTTNGTYWDAAGDTSDSRGSPGSRSLLIFQDHANTTNPVFTGSGQLSFSGALYFHSSGYSDVLALSGGTSSGTYVLGEIIADQVQLTGSGMIKLALNPQATANMSKVAIVE